MNTKTTTRFVCNLVDEEITDTRTGLIWKRYSEGRSFNGCVSPKLFTWHEAMSHAAAQPGGWRLPTFDEMLELNVLMDKDFVFMSNLFPGDPVLDLIWRASPPEDNTPHACLTSFYYGGTYFYDKDKTSCVRLVRG